MTQWRKVKLGDITTWSSGGTPSKNNKDFWTGTIPWISAKSMKFDFIEDSELKISEDGLHSGSRMADVDDLLLLVRGSELFNRIPICYVKRPVSFNQDVKAIKPTKYILPLFLFYWFKSQENYLMSKVESTGIGAGKFSQVFLQELEVNLPPFPEQKRIADILSGFDDKIELNRKMCKTLESMAQALFKSWFVDFEPFQDGEFIESELGPIPKDWAWGTVGTLASRIFSGGTPNTSKKEYWGGILPWLSSGETRNNFVIKTEKTITEDGVANSSTRLAHKHDIVMASAGQGLTRGQTSYLLLDTYINQSVIVISSEIFRQPYIYFNLSNRYEELRGISDASSIRGSLTTKMISQFPLLIAPDDILKQYAEIVMPYIDKIESIIKTNDVLSQMRDELLRKLMNNEGGGINE